MAVPPVRTISSPYNNVWLLHMQMCMISHLERENLMPTFQKWLDKQSSSCHLSRPEIMVVAVMLGQSAKSRATNLDRS